MSEEEKSCKDCKWYDSGLCFYGDCFIDDSDPMICLSEDICEHFDQKKELAEIVR